MTKIKYDINLMKYISLFESMTNAHVRDCINNEMLIFVVDEGEIGKAIGKQGANVKRLGSMLNKPIKVVEFNSEVTQFIRNFIHPLQAKEIRNEDNTVTIVGPDTKTKGMLIGRDGKNLNELKSVVKRYFPVEDIKVV